jgi:Zn-dependent protease with chaperone function
LNVAIAGTYFDGLSSAAHPAELSVRDGSVMITSTTEAFVSVAAATSAVTVGDRVGNIPRRVLLPSGASFETRDNDAVDAVFGRGHVLHRFERRWQVALASLIAVVVGSFAFVRFGVPVLASVAVNFVPVSVEEAMGQQSLVVIEHMFEPSTLSATRQAELRVSFDALAGAPQQLEFRSSKHIGANAFALPGGVMVMTDELVALAKHDEEILAVLGHELGHVRGRHALRQLLQHAGVSVLALVVLGDVSSVSALASALPMVLQAKHTRDLEIEADAFAKQWLATHNIATHRFDDILCRMSEGHEGEEWMVFLSSHPPTNERVSCEPHG